MAVRTQIDEAGVIQLEADTRWQLVERILASQVFERATQLRLLLHHISKMALLHPEVTLREYDIACDVLGRRADFDPSRDNIVRAQVSHLRRKLEIFFNTEGKDEPVILTIQKGSYSPVFRPSTVVPPLDEAASIGRATPSPHVDVPTASSPTLSAPPMPQAKRRAAHPSLILPVILASVSAAFLLGWHYGPGRSESFKASSGNAFLHFLGSTQGNVTIVTPDLSLVMVREMSGATVTLSDYTAPDYPARQLSIISDPVMRGKVSGLAAFPNTTLNEAMIGLDFKDAMQEQGIHSTLRSARTLHVQDFSQGNSLLIGGEGSNLWTSLFTEKMNFRFVEVNDHLHYFVNSNPLPGEVSRYPVIYPNEGKIAVGYADIALTQNPTRTGYVLLVNGSDLQVSEAATQYLLHGKLAPEITKLLSRKDLLYFEILLKGTHVGQEAEDTMDVIAIRQ